VNCNTEGSISAGLSDLRMGMLGSVTQLCEISTSGSPSLREWGVPVMSLAAVVGVVRGEEPFERLTKRDGGSVIAVDAESRSDADVRIDVVSDDVLVVLDDRSSESCEVPVLDARSRNGGVRGMVIGEGAVVPRRGDDIRASSLTASESLVWSRWSIRSLDDLRDGFRDRSGWS
jgi:hypothetical protein